MADVFRPEAVAFAVEDGAGGVWCSDGVWRTAQLVEWAGAKPRLWPAAAAAMEFCEDRKMLHFLIVPVDRQGQALV